MAYTSTAQQEQSLVTGELETHHTWKDDTHCQKPAFLAVMQIRIWEQETYHDIWFAADTYFTWKPHLY